MAKLRSEKEQVCSFCGKSADTARRIIAGPGVFICDHCVDVCRGILDEENQQLSTEFTGDIPTPKEMKAHLDQYIIGQEQAKKTLAVAIYNHYKRIANPDEVPRRRRYREIERASDRTDRIWKDPSRPHDRAKDESPVRDRRCDNSYRSGVRR